MKPRNILLLRRMSLAPSLGAALLVAGAFVGWLILAGAHPANASTLETRSTLVRGEYDAQTSGKADHTCGATSGAVSGENVVLTSAVIAKEDLKGVYVQFEIYSRSRGISGVLDSPSKYHLDLDEGDIGEFSTTIDTILHPGDDWTARCTVRANHPSIPFVDETVSAEKTASFTVGPMTYGNPRSWLSSCDPSQNVQRVVPGAAISIVAIGRAENDTTAEKSGYRIFGHIYKDGEKKNEYVWRRSATGGNKLLFENSFNAPESPGRYTLDCVLVTENLNYDLLNRIKNVQSCQSGHYVPAVAACVASLSLAERVVWRPVWIISFTFCVGDESDCPGTSPGAGTTATEPPPAEGTTPEPAPVTPVPPPASPPAPEPPSSSDRAALIALYNSTSGARWINNLQGRETWLIGQSGSGLDDWYGVETHDNGRVKYLLLEFDNNLHGTLPPRLGNLTESLVLSIKGNERDGRSLLGVRGSIPGELGNLTALQELYLSGNELTGGIPEALGNLSELDALDLSDNRLSGNIPAALGNLTLLRDLDLSGNRLEGDIPAALAKLTDLESLYLSGGSNTFTGCIPSGLRRVDDHDLDDLGIPFCDVALSGLTVSPGQLDEPFDSTQTSFSATVYQSRITVAPAAVESGSFDILNDGGNLIADADAVASGHQVDLSSDDETIRVRITSGSGRNNETYTLDITVEGPSVPGAPTIGAVTAQGASLLVPWSAAAGPGASAATSYNLRHIRTDASDKADANWTPFNGFRLARFQRRELLAAGPGGADGLRPAGAGGQRCRLQPVVGQRQRHHRRGHTHQLDHLRPGPAAAGRERVLHPNGNGRRPLRRQLRLAGGGWESVERR